MYIRRYIEQVIGRKLRSSGAVLVTGPKFCGKTTTCTLFQKSMIRLNTRQRIELARLDPMQTLEGETPRLIDEWQTVPEIWDAVKEKLDEEYRFGSFLLTGSATPADKTEIIHSGTGRITPIQMRPMTLFESGDSGGEISLIDLFDGGSGFRTLPNEGSSIRRTAWLLCRGGWPVSVLADREIALEVTRNYCSGLFLFENSENERFRNKDPEILRMILKSYARNISTEAPNSTIIADVRGVNGRTMDPKTFSAYTEALRDLFILSDLPAWSPYLRSKTSIRSTPTRHFTDPSVAAGVLGISPDDLLNDLNTFGFFFEDMAVRDLSVYCSVYGGEVRHYRDNTGLECDAVIRLEDGRWAAVEVKLGGRAGVEAGAESLKRLSRKFGELSDEKAPSFLAVLTAYGPAYRREDGVYVVPIDQMKA